MESFPKRIPQEEAGKLFKLMHEEVESPKPAREVKKKTKEILAEAARERRESAAPQTSAGAFHEWQKKQEEAENRQASQNNPS
ncbi:MAG: hypothetical protein G01um101472_233 [Parcubacteria group bacterium Gr01-1014_72]|nr:MAG: hypothetical protein G01um101472_233 [Parcubacteria group bacterium Gr01-1014_72]